MKPGEKALQAVQKAESQGPEQAAQLALGAVYAAEQEATAAATKLEKARADLRAALNLLPDKKVELEGGAWRADVRTVTDTRFDPKVILDLLTKEEYDRGTKPAIDREGLRLIQDERLAQGRDPLPIVVVQEERMYVTFAGAARAKRTTGPKPISESAVAATDDPDEWVVRSSTGSGTYAVRRSGEEWSCSCPHWMQRHPPTDKHIDAVKALVARGHFGGKGVGA